MSNIIDFYLLLSAEGQFSFISSHAEPAWPRQIQTSWTFFFCSHFTDCWTNCGEKIRTAPYWQHWMTYLWLDMSPPFSCLSRRTNSLTSGGICSWWNSPTTHHHSIWFGYVIRTFEHWFSASLFCFQLWCRSTFPRHHLLKSRTKHSLCYHSDNSLACSLVICWRLLSHCSAQIYPLLSHFQN